MINTTETVGKLQRLAGKGRNCEYVLSKDECMEIIKLIYNIGINDCCDAILETSSTGCHNHVERLLIET